MGMILANSITTVNLNFHEDKEVQIQIASAQFPADSLQDVGVMLPNFNDAWAFISDRNIDKEILSFYRDSRGSPAAHFITKTGDLNSEDLDDTQKYDTLQWQGNSDTSKETHLTDMLQTAVDTISELQQERNHQDDEIEKLTTKIKTLEHAFDCNNPNLHIEDYNSKKPFTYFELSVFISGGVILATLLVNFIMPCISKFF